MLFVRHLQLKLKFIHEALTRRKRLIYH